MVTIFAAGLQLERDLPSWGDLPYYLTAWLQDAGSVAMLGIVLWAVHYASQRGSRPAQRPGRVGVIFAAAAAVGLACFLAAFALSFTFSTAPGAVNSTAAVLTFYWLMTVGGAAAIFAAAFPMLARLAGRISGRRIWAISQLSIRESLRGGVVLAFAPLLLIFLFADWFLSYKPEDQIRTYVSVYYWAFPPVFLLLAMLLGSFSIPADVTKQTIHTVVTKPVERYEIVLGRFLGSAIVLTVPMAVLAALSLVFVAGIGQVWLTLILAGLFAAVPALAGLASRYLGGDTAAGNAGLLFWLRFACYPAAVVCLVVAVFLLAVATPNVTPEARQESYKARVAVFADALRFSGTGNPQSGENVGREWTYRSYIHGREPGSSDPTQYAVWSFRDLPAHLAGRRTPVPFEFTFDIFRTTKGKEDLGVNCDITLADGALSVPEVERRLQEFEAALIQKQNEIRGKWEEWHNKAATSEERLEIEEKQAQELQEARNELVREFKVYQVTKTVTDYHTLALEVPPALFQGILAGDRPAAQPDEGEGPPPALKVLVSVGADAASRMQRLGAAKRDIYLLAAELPFWQNFLKGVFGIWCNTMLVLGIAITCSTYLSGIISLITTFAVLGLGTVVEYIRSLAAGRSVGGGPFESAYRLFSNTPMALPLDRTATTTMGGWIDTGYEWLLGQVLKLIPDVHRYDLTLFVANGFDISWTQVLLLDNFLPMLGYLIPCGVLAYYLINSREVANPM